MIQIAVRAGRIQAKAAGLSLGELWCMWINLEPSQRTITLDNDEN